MIKTKGFRKSRVGIWNKEGMGQLQKGKLRESWILSGMNTYGTLDKLESMGQLISHKQPKIVKVKCYKIK